MESGQSSRACTEAALKDWTVIGLRLDEAYSILLIAAVVPGSLAEDVVILRTSEADFTRWAMVFQAPDDADAAAAQAYAYCRTEPGLD